MTSTPHLSFTSFSLCGLCAFLFLLPVQRWRCCTNALDLNTSPTEDQMEGRGEGARGRRWKLFGTRKTRKSWRRAPGFNMLEKKIISNGRPVTGRGHVCSESAELSVLLYVHRNRRFIRDGSPGRPPRLSHSSWALTLSVDDDELMLNVLRCQLTY